MLPWEPYMANSLSADGIQIGNAYSAMALATVISPFFVGIIADRFFPCAKIIWCFTFSRAPAFFIL
jgi:hypothetical protein